VRWLLEEMGLAYEDKQLSYDKKEHKGPEYLKINSMGTVPAVEIDGKLMIESVAICAYLADKHQDKKMAPALDSQERMDYMQWMFFIPATVEPILVEGFKASEENRSQVMAKMKEDIQPSLDLMSKALAGKDYLVGNQFSAADIIVSTALCYAQNFQLLEGRDNLLSYFQNMKQRAAAEKSGVFLPIPTK
jgi:glutathione S-transferase